MRRQKVKYRQGIYKPQNPEKCVNVAQKKPIEYRSQLEFEYLFLLDRSPEVVKWGSEVIWVPYENPWKKRVCQYWTDIYVETKNHGVIVIEIKPEKEIKAIVEGKQPKQTKRKKRATYLYEVKMYEINKAKWLAAKRFCDVRGWKFIQLSEKNLKEKNIPFI